MDGTLVDSNAVVEAAWGWWAKRHSIPLTTVLQFSHGRPTVATMEHFLPGRDHQDELAEMARFEETQVGGSRPIPGAIEVVQAVRDYPWAIVTSAWRALAEARVSEAGLPLPRVIVPVDEIENGKPHPEGFLRAAELLKVPSAECVVFEDTRAGIEAGLAGGMQVVGLLTTMTAEQLNHKPLIRDFRDVQVRAEGDHLQLHLRNAL